MQTTMYAVMVNDKMYPDSLSHTKDGASSYLSDAKEAAAVGADVRVVKVIIRELADADRLFYSA